MVGCNEWPRYQHKPSVNSAALSPEQPPQDGLDMVWIEHEPIDESDDRPGDALPLDVGQGIIARGSLSGLGWSADETPDRLSDCGQNRAFPPAAPGDYIGDVDWLTVQVSENSTLCMSMETDVEEARLDIPLYQLDECDEPVSVFVHPDSETPIGLNVDSAQAQWAIPVGAESVLSLGIAGFFPDDQDLEATWHVNLSLVPSVLGAGASLCPTEHR